MPPPVPSVPAAGSPGYPPPGPGIPASAPPNEHSPPPAYSTHPPSPSKFTILAYHIK